MQLGDAGADVIKIELPGGDSARSMPPFIADESAVFLSLNRNKQSIVIDYRTSDGAELVRRLARSADVFIEDLGSAALARGLSCEHLRRENPRIVHCAISAFGEDGPLKDAPGSELVIQAMAEYAASLGKIGDPPVRLGADVAALNTGTFATQAILAALFHRGRSGEGQRVSVSQFGSLLHMRGIMWQAMTDPDDWYGFHLDHYTHAPEYGYQTADGAIYFLLRRGNTEDWDRLLLELDMMHVLDDPRFADCGRLATGVGRYAAEVKPIWEEAFKRHTSADIVKLVHSLGGDAVPMMDYDSLLAHPQVEALCAIVEIDHPKAGAFKTIRPVARFSATPNAIRRPPPMLGEHTNEVLAALGLDTTEIARLRSLGIVA